MPVPVSVTNPNGKGLVAHAVEAVETEGPFARLARQAAAPATQATPVNIPQPTTQAATNGSAAQPANEQHEYSIHVQNLSFAYPGLGE